MKIKETLTIEEEKNTVKNIELVKNFELGEIADGEKSKDVKAIFNGTRRLII